MDRLIFKQLHKWKSDTGRKPLILQGVRQCGKTWTLKEFGNREFEDTAYFNLEDSVAYQDIFERDLNPERIITELGLLRNKTIIPGKTFLILDEIQSCPRAITSLKYFCENLPELHVAAAGSLLGVAVTQMGKQISYPVGKIDTLTLYPLNFEEFLLANGEELLCEHLKSADEVSVVFQKKLEGYYHQYLITGGMPASVSSWTDAHDINAIERILENIISDYEKDFIKYAPTAEFPKLMQIWKGIPVQLARDNQKFIFSHIKSGARARDLEDALYWLLSSGLLYKVVKAEQPFIPLTVHADSSFFKIYLADVGILRKLAGFPVSAVTDSSESSAYMRGMLAENFVLTELIANHSFTPSGLVFWKSNNIAEIDYLLQNELDVIPIEVKSGKNTRSKSLYEYRKRYLPKTSLRTSLQMLTEHADNSGTVLEIPLYLLWNLKHYL